MPFACMVVGPPPMLVVLSGGGRLYIVYMFVCFSKDMGFVAFSRRYIHELCEQRAANILKINQSQEDSRYLTSNQPDNLFIAGDLC